jgi:hypothetical protein
MLLIAAVLSVATLTAQSPADPQLAVISARIGDCSADFTVKDVDGKPIYAAIVHVRIRYGFMGVKRMDLEVGTNSEGQARVEGLPAKGTPLTYDISQADRKGTVAQDLATSCRAKYEVSLK